MADRAHLSIGEVLSLVQEEFLEIVRRLWAGETVDLPSLDRQAKRAAILMTRLSREKR